MYFIKIPRTDRQCVVQSEQVLWWILPHIMLKIEAAALAFIVVNESKTQIRLCRSLLSNIPYYDEEPCFFAFQTIDDAIMWKLSM